MKLVPFFLDHKDHFLSLSIIIQAEASRKVTEVSCERFFGTSGYVSQPRRSRLGVSNYERISMLSNIVQNMYIDPEWVASEYLKRCKKGAWKKENTVDALKCFNLERILTASQFNLETPDEVGMEKYMEGFQLGV